MGKWTPGPWVVSEGTLVQNADKTLGICDAFPVDPNGKEFRYGDDTFANARLMAAAPELFSELKQADAQMEMAAECIEAGRYDEALLHVRSLSRARRAAIAKATGETP